MKGLGGYFVSSYVPSTEYVLIDGQFILLNVSGLNKDRSLLLTHMIPLLNPY